MASPHLSGKPDPMLIQQERAIVRRFRQASSSRKLEEDTAAARLIDIDDRYAATKRTIEEWLTKVQQPVGVARISFQNVGEGYLLPAPGIGSQAKPSFVNPTLSDVQRALTTATDTNTKVRKLCEELGTVRGARSRSQPTPVTVVALFHIVAAIVFFILMLVTFSANEPGFGVLALLQIALACFVAYGLFTRKEWARILAMFSPLAYGIVPQPSCTGCMLVIMAGACGVTWYYLKEPAVKAYFSSDTDSTSILEQMRDAANTLAASEATARLWHDNELKAAGTAYQTERATAEAENQQKLAQATTNYATALKALRNDISRVNTIAGKDAAPWASENWRDWEPPQDTGQPPLARLGVLTQISGLASPQHDALLAPGAQVADFPLFAPVIAGQRPLLFNASGAAKAQAVDAIQSLLLRLLMTIPPGKLRFTFIDPVGLGQNVAPFMYLKDYDDQLITSRAWTEPAHIEEQLGNLAEHMENVIQNYLRNEFRTIEEYNKSAGEVAEPYRVLVVFDFPTGFTETAARRLISIANNGPRCGVFAVVLADPAQPLPYGFNINDLTQPSSLLTWTNNRYVWRFNSDDSEFDDCTVQLDRLPDQRAIAQILQGSLDRLEKRPQTLADCSIEHIMQIVGKEAVANNKVEAPFARIAPERAQWWQADSRERLRIPLGPVGARKFQYLDLGGEGTAHHALVVGKTGSGKSRLLHAIVGNLALTYRPEEVEVYIIDFKEGVDFKPFATHRLPHGRVIVIESEREYGLSVLNKLSDEMERRGALFKAADTNELKKYRDKTGEQLPRILLLVDEFQDFFAEDDQIADQARQLLDLFVSKGRGFGIHVMLASQTLARSATLPRAIIGQMGVRIALQCDEADARLILADDNPAARLLERPGDAIYNDKNGLIAGNSRFQVAFLSDADEEEYLEQLRAMAAGRRYPQTIFEGNALGAITENTALATLITQPDWPAPATGEKAWLGEPIAIASHVAGDFRRQSGSNLMIVGQNGEAAMGMLATSLISLAAQHHPGQNAPNHARFLVVDYTPVDSPLYQYLPQLIAQMPHAQQTMAVIPGRRLEESLSNLVAEIQQRIAREDELENSAPVAQERPDSIYLMIYGLQRARDLRPDDTGGFAMLDSDAPPSPDKLFASVLHDGPEVGVHTLVWCDNVTNLNHSIEHRALREFSMRVAFQMTADDSSSLLDTPAAAKLGPYRAFYVSEDDGVAIKFRPYGLPPTDWVAWCAGRLRERAGVRQQVTPPNP